MPTLYIENFYRSNKFFLSYGLYQLLPAPAAMRTQIILAITTILTEIEGGLGTFLLPGLRIPINIPQKISKIFDKAATTSN